MRAYRTEQIVPESHLLTVQLPPGTPTGPAQVIVLFADEPLAPATGEAPAPVTGFAGLADFAQWLQTQPASTRPAEEIARQIEDERNAWD